MSRISTRPQSRERSKARALAVILARAKAENDLLAEHCEIALAQLRLTEQERNRYRQALHDITTSATKGEKWSRRIASEALQRG